MKLTIEGTPEEIKKVISTVASNDDHPESIDAENAAEQIRSSLLSDIGTR